MSSYLHQFRAPRVSTVVALRFPLDEVVDDWSGLRSVMIREIPEEFTRDEWAYLVSFLGSENLMGVFETTFGESVSLGSSRSSIMAQPCGQVAVWLPNNVSLLGPLVLILLSLTGNPMRLKGGQDSEDLTGVFLRYALKHLNQGKLLNYLQHQVKHEVFGREDPRSAVFAAESQVRIVFGSDEAARAIHNLPHPLGSKAYSFIDRRSEAWIEKSCISDQLILDLLKVFAIYGQAGCTSPRRVVLLGASVDDAVQFTGELSKIWIAMKRPEPAMHIASNNIMGQQLANALGWKSRLSEKHGAVFAAGNYLLPECPMPMGLMVVAATAEEARNRLPTNIQTIGSAFVDPEAESWLRFFAGTRVKRIVPLSSMHHFGPVWDGEEFWRGCFDLISLT